MLPLATRIHTTAVLTFDNSSSDNQTRSSRCLIIVSTKALTRITAVTVCACVTACLLPLTYKPLLLFSSELPVLDSSREYGCCSSKHCRASRCSV
jgi:hypothetical protein